jgi:O-antigen/teichoic acid export membrane protein
MFFQSFEVIDFFFQAQVNGKAISKCKLFQLSISSILKILFIFKKFELIYFIFITLLDFISLSLSLLIAYHKNNLYFFPFQFDGNLARQLLRRSWYLALAGIIVILYMRIDQLMIGEFLGLKQVGLYSIAVRLCEIWYVIPALISDALFPAIINAKTINPELYQKRLIRLFSFLFWLSAIIGVLTCIFSSTLINKLFGVNYFDAVPVVIIYAWAGIFVSFGVASEKWLITEDLNVFSFLRTFSGLVLNIIANLFLIPKYGIIGAAWATLFSYGVAGLFFDLIFDKTRFLFFMKISSINPRRMLDE